MAHEQEIREVQQIHSCDAYFDIIQTRKKLPRALQEPLTAAFAQIPASAFPGVPGGEGRITDPTYNLTVTQFLMQQGEEVTFQVLLAVIEIPADTLVSDAVKILSKRNITSAPVVKQDPETTKDLKERYLGILDYSAVVSWVLESAELAAAAIMAGSAAAVGVGAGVAGALGAVALGATGPAAIAGLTVAAVGAAAAGGAAADKEIGRDAPTAAAHLGDDFYKVILHEEPFKSTKVTSIVRPFGSTPFLSVETGSSMLTVLLLLSKYRLRNVPVIEPGNPSIKNYITQSAVIQGLEGCKGRDWFDIISAHPISDLGLPFMSCDDVISIQSDELILEAFKRLKDNEIGGLPVVEGSKKKIVGNISMRDIKYLLLHPELFSNVRQLKVKDFINKIASEAQEARHVVPPITCKLESTLGSVIHTLASKAVHRIYVVAGEEDGVVGVITLRDVISCFIYEPPNHFDSPYGFPHREALPSGFKSTFLLPQQPCFWP